MEKLARILKRMAFYLQFSKVNALKRESLIPFLGRQRRLLFFIFLIYIFPSSTLPLLLQNSNTTVLNFISTAISTFHWANYSHLNNQ